MRPARVLVVDDSRTGRRLLARIVESDPGLELAGTAANGLAALQRLEDTAPDLVVLDLEMPHLDGLGTLAEIRRRRPGLPVIIWSAHVGSERAASRDALLLGAAARVVKPGHAGGADGATDAIRRDLLPAIHACSAAWATRRPPAAPVPRVPAVRGAGGPRRLEAVAIGASAGGPEALATLLAGLPAAFLAPILVAIHMPADATRALARQLALRSGLPVAEAVPGEALLPGRVVIAPGGLHLIARRSRGELVVGTHMGAPQHSCRPSVDVLFRSVADACGPAALGVVLTGMGGDGLAGCRALHDAGGRVFVQDAGSSLVWGMARFVVEAGLAERQVPLQDLSRVIADAAGAGAPGRAHPRRIFPGGGDGAPALQVRHPVAGRA